MINKQLKKGVLELCILAQISQSDCYGFELIDLINKEIPTSASTIYPILRRLTNDEYLMTYKGNESEGYPRTYYKITESGIRQLQLLKEEYHIFHKAVTKLIKSSRR